MKALYTHRVYNLSGQLNEAVIDLRKVTAIHRSGGKIEVYMQSKAVLTVYEMPDVKEVKDSADYNAATQRAYDNLIAAWKAAQS